MGAPVVHWEINARDAKRMQDFYATLFDWKVDANNPMNYGMVHTGVEMGINGGIGQMREESHSRVTVYIQVEDIQAYLDRAERLGGRLVMPVTEFPGMVTMAMFADPEGNTVGLVKGSQAPPKKKTAPQKSRRAKAKPRTKPGRRGKKSKRR